jgi:hypothetical protein
MGIKELAFLSFPLTVRVHAVIPCCGDARCNKALSNSRVVYVGHGKKNTTYHGQSIIVKAQGCVHIKMMSIPSGQKKKCKAYAFAVALCDYFIR